MGLNFDISADEVDAQVDPHVPPEDKPVPTRTLFVVALPPGMTDDDFIGETNYEVIGHIEEPTAFCPGFSCEHKANHKDPLSSFRKGMFWVQQCCGLPTRAWWEATFRDLVEVPEQRPQPGERS